MMKHQLSIASHLLNLALELTITEGDWLCQYFTHVYSHYHTKRKNQIRNLRKEEILVLHLKAYKHTVFSSIQFMDSLTTFL